MIGTEQQRICAKYGAPPFEAPEDLKAGVSSNVRSHIVPVHGLRHPPEAGTTGWYIWAGDVLSADPNFFLPLHVAHLKEWRPEVVKFLALPPGWRFLIDGDYEDVWYDPSLLLAEKR